MTGNNNENTQILGEHAQKLKEYVEIIRAKQTLYCATIINCSIIADATERYIYSKIVEKWFEDIIKTFAGRYFHTDSGVLIIVIKNIGMSALEKRFNALAEIISHDEYFFKISRISLFSEIYRIYNFQAPVNFESFVRDTIYVIDPENTTKNFPNDERGKFIKSPATARQISKSEEYISTVNLKNFVQQTPIFSFFPDHGVAEKLFTEASIKLDELCKILLPSNELDPSSFLRYSLDDACQKRLLRLLAMRSVVLGTKSVGLKLSQGAICSPEFLSFVTNNKWNNENFLVVEVDIYNVLHNINSYTECLKFLRSRGHIVAIHGVNLDVLSLVNAEYLDFDLLFFEPPENFAHHHSFDIQEIIKNIILQIRPERFILRNINSLESLQVGVKMGAQLFQGEKIEAISRQWIRDSKTS